MGWIRRPAVAAAAAVVVAGAVGAAPALAQTEADDYATAIGGLEARAAVLVTNVEAVNAAWDSGDATFNTTLESMLQIETETNAISSELSALVPPEELEGQHGVMEDVAAAMSQAAADMIAGLQGADAGEARATATTTYLAAATDFSDLALLAQGGAEQTTTTTTPAETTTSSIATTTTTTVAPATTTTTSIAVQPATEPADDGSGAPWLLLPVVMILGVALGAIGGLVIGRRARVELIETARRLREGSPEPPPD